MSVDNLPKDDTQNEPFSFTGTYPQSGDSGVSSVPLSTTTATPAVPVVQPDQPVSAQPQSNPATSSQETAQFVPPEPFAPSEQPMVSTVPVESVSQEPSPQAAQALPQEPGAFVVTDAPQNPPAKKSGGKRILAVVVMLIALLVVGFLAFTVVGKLLTSGKPIVLTYWGLWENEQILEPVIAEYKKTHPNVEIAYSRQNPKQYRERLQAALDRGEGPDIFRFHASWVPMFKNNLAPAGKGGYTVQEFNDAFYPVMQKDLVVGGQPIGVPLMFEGLALYYNEDLLRSAGITPPSSWEDFREASLALTVRDENDQIITAGAALGTANNIEHFSDIVALMILQNGGDLKNPISKEAQDAISFYRLYAEPPGNTWDATLDNSIQAFAAGRVAFIFAPSWQVFTVRQINPELEFKTIPIPQLPGTNVTWASYWAEGVSQKSANQKAAWEFLKFLSSKESLITLYTEASKTREFGEPYSRVDLAQTLANDPYVGAYINQAPTAESFFLSSRTFDNGINDRMIKYLEDGINSLDQGNSVDGALTTVGQGFQQVLSSFGASAR